ELGDGLQALGTGQGGNDGKGEDGGQRVTPPPAETRVGDGSEDFDQGQGLTHYASLLALGQEDTYPLPAASPRSTGKQPWADAQLGGGPQPVVVVLAQGPGN